MDENLQLPDLYRKLLSDYEKGYVKSIIETALWLAEKNNVYIGDKVAIARVYYVKHSGYLVVKLYLASGWKVTVVIGNEGKVNISIAGDGNE